MNDIDRLIHDLESELDKTDAHIAQLENALSLAIRQNQCDMLMTGEEIRLCEQAINGSTDTWLSEHDKAVEVRVLEDVYSIANDQADVNLNIYASRFLSALTVMIESRK